MPERVWFRSLYWRVAFGFVAFLAVMLVVQGSVLFWLVGRASDEVTGQSPHDLATLVASDLSAAMAAGSLGDPGQYLRERYGAVSRSVALIMADGRMFASRDNVEIPPQMAEMAMRRYRLRRPPPPDGWQGPVPGGQPPGPRGIDRPPGEAPNGMRGAGGLLGPPPRRAMGMAPVVRDSRTIAVVIVPPMEPLPTLLRQFAPTALALAGGLLVVATGLAALFVFRPAQRRLSALEAAARQLGSGVLAARAPVEGGDEVTAVARAFNAMADDLAQRTSQLMAATDARRQLLADVSHELMTPLTAIRGYLETLQMTELQLEPDARARYLAVVSSEAERLERMIGDLLDMARLEAGGGTLARALVDAAVLFQRVVERHEREARDKGVRFTTRVDAAAATLYVDAGRMEQVLQNLAANALRHTPAGGDVELRSEPRTDGIALTVRDTGEGIPPEHVERVFDRFYKADEARGADGRGSGLGLSIAKAIIERHGGRITVQSTQGRETVFEIILPLPPD